MTATYYIKCVEIKGNKLILVLNPTGASENSNERFTDQFFLAILRDAESINRCWHTTIQIDTSQNVLLNEISDDNYMSLMKMAQATAGFNVKQFIVSWKHIENGKQHLLSILDSWMEDGPTSLNVSRSQVLFRRFQKISGTVFSDWKKLHCCCCQKEFIDLYPNTRKLDPGFMLRTALVSCQPFCNLSKTHPVAGWSRGYHAGFFDLKKLFKYILAKFPIARDTDMVEFMNTAISEVNPKQQSQTEENVEEGEEMNGMSVVVAGATNDLGMEQIVNLIEDHAGEVSPQVTNETHFVVATETELSNKPKKIQEALDLGVPVFNINFVLNLCNRKDDSIALRTDTAAAAKYLIQGSPLIGERKLCKLKVPMEVEDRTKVHLVLITEKEMAAMYHNWDNKIYQPSKGEPELLDKPDDYSTDYKKAATLFKQKRDIPAVIRMDASNPVCYHQRLEETAAFETGAHAIAASLINRACSVRCARNYAAKKSNRELFDGSDVYFSYVEDTYEVEVTQAKYRQHLQVGFKWETTCFVP